MLRNKAARKYLSALLLGGIAISSCANAAATPDFDFFGPIERSDCATHTIQILGSKLVSTNASLSSAICSGDYSIPLVEAIAIAHLSSDGRFVLTKLVRVGPPNYVAGASLVYLKGIASEKSSDAGFFRVAGTEVSAPANKISKGDIVEVVGTQPVLGGTVLATQIATTSTLLGQEGGVAGNSSVGSGVQLQSSVGSGGQLESSIGSGRELQSSIGSGAAVQSSIGSGIQLQSSIGSGAQVQSSIGSGAAVQSSIGSGKQLQSSIGSGAAVQSSVGSGKQLQSSTGSGAQTQSSIGSGRQLLSSVGSGAEIQSSTGSGKQLQSSVGSGLQ